jgi:hypothetical protein
MSGTSQDHTLLGIVQNVLYSIHICTMFYTMLACFLDRGRVCVFFIDGKYQDQQCNDNRMARSEEKTPGVKEVTHDKNDEIVKCKTTTFRGFGYRELEVSRTLTTRMSKRRNVKHRNTLI